MCETIENAIVIEDKTNKGKYEFLKFYYAKWNSIVKTHPRVIIDTHAGTGAVNYQQSDGTTELIYGSPLIALLKTVTISQNLKLILSEADNTNYDILCQYISKFQNDGIPILETTPKKMRQLNLRTKRTRKVVESPKRIYPDRFNFNIPPGYELKQIKSHAEIFTIHDKIENTLDGIIEKYVKNFSIQKADGTIQDFKPKVIFFVDPCASIEWDLISKIGNLCIDESGEKIEGVEMILNWSTMAIYRNPDNWNLKSKIYGMSELDLRNKISDEPSLDDQLHFYKEKLGQYWNCVEEVGIPLTGHPKIKKKSTPAYHLLYCTNNKSGKSLAQNKMNKLKEDLLYFDNEKLTKWIKPKKKFKR
jgi:hypothetical protein